MQEGGRVATFSDFYRAEFPRVVRAVGLITRDVGVAQEVTQEAFIKTYAKWGRVSRYDRPDRWVRKVAVRLAIRAAARGRRFEELKPVHDVGTKDRHDDSGLAEAVTQLPPRQSASVALFYLEDRPVSEIATILECSESTVNVHLHKARKRLAELLREDEVTNEPR